MPKSDRYIEKDKKLLGRPRKSRLVTYLDLKNPKFMEEYPDAEIGQQITDPKPLFWKSGLKRKPTQQEQHARIAAQFRADLQAEMELGQAEDLLDEDFEDSPLMSSYEAVNAVFEGIPEQLASAEEGTPEDPQISEGEPSSSDDQSE